MSKPPPGLYGTIQSMSLVGFHPLPCPPPSDSVLDPQPASASAATRTATRTLTRPRYQRGLGENQMFMFVRSFLWVLRSELPITTRFFVLSTATPVHRYFGRISSAHSSICRVSSSIVA